MALSRDNFVANDECELFPTSRVTLEKQIKKSMKHYSKHLLTT